MTAARPAEPRIPMTHGTDATVETAASLANAFEPAIDKTIVLTVP